MIYLNPFVELIRSILGLYNGVVLFWLIGSLLIYFDIVNYNQPLVKKAMYFLNAMVMPALQRIRKIIPPIGGVDISVVALYLAIRFVDNILLTYFYS